MNKLLLILGLSAAVAFGQKPECLKLSDPPLNKILAQYSKQKTEFDKNRLPSQGYIYKIENIGLFPYFCLPGKIKEPKSPKVFLDDYTGSIYKYKDSIGDFHIQIGILNYIKDRGEINSKTYKLFFYLYKKGSDSWIEEKEPEKVVFIKKGDYYIPKD